MSIMKYVYWQSCAHKRGVKREKPSTESPALRGGGNCGVKDNKWGAVGGPSPPDGGFTRSECQDSTATGQISKHTCTQVYAHSWSVVIQLLAHQIVYILRSRVQIQSVTRFCWLTKKAASTTTSSLMTFNNSISTCHHPITTLFTLMTTKLTIQPVIQQVWILPHSEIRRLIKQSNWIHCDCMSRSNVKCPLFSFNNIDMSPKGTYCLT